eukprot:CAMPEP_0171260864 /NCGR_PEP_ID=MMETSP0790-20130122/55680_1 /TAXON_ID=2925 /ORGANISM="Alexandrium catenella, Strain OF101" /LENGTH=111 /DNA_ID=CAMNT_0011729217 /DNA_START=79 /DNA_END=411 /DNA_ORIENTATION=+
MVDVGWPRCTAGRENGGHRAVIQVGVALDPICFRELRRHHWSRAVLVARRQEDTTHRAARLLEADLGVTAGEVDGGARQRGRLCRHALAEPLGPSGTAVVVRPQGAIDEEA